MQSKHSFVSESEDIGGTYPGGLRALGHFRGIPPMAGGQGSALGPGSIPGAADWLVIPHKTDLLAGQRRRAHPTHFFTGLPVEIRGVLVYDGKKCMREEMLWI